MGIARAMKVSQRPEMQGRNPLSVNVEENMVAGLIPGVTQFGL